ncbi:hypothetical protein Golob_022727 [Gossypium lobatum]|uniref:DUF4283 domain-containing protein n=1 Tax=Gossypium lobatum TaxID=34289 RepID=A0A7J8LHF1_9ROSI|nr:hypothetical protein [Gossypium lobatum]
MANLNMVGADLENHNIMDEEEDPLVVVGDDMCADLEYGLCLVGRVLTDSIVNFPSLKNTLADLWHPLREVSIMEIVDKHILFRFYSKIDLKWVMDGMPWDQQVDFSWDLSLRATPIREGQLMSKWLREESENEMWANMDIDRENTARRFDNMGQIEGRGDEVELEDMPVEFVDGKKTQRFNLEVGGSDNRRGLLDGGLENAISTAATKLADRVQ